MADVIGNQSGGRVDTGNSSVATLGISGNFTGTGVDLMGFSAVCVTLDSSHDSATDGMTFEFSTDNTNWDDVYTFTYTAANGARRFQFPVTARYFRVNYTNGGTGQTTFRLQTVLHTENQLTSIHRLVDDVHPDRSAQVMKSVLLAQTSGAGDFKALQANAAGIIKVAGVVEGTVAHDSPDVDPPVKVGNVAIAHGTNPTAVAADDVTDWYANRAGVPFVIGGHPNIITKTARNTAAQTNTILVESGSARVVVTAIDVTCDNSNTVDVDFTVGFHATTLATPATGTGTEDILLNFMGCPAGGGMVKGNGGGILGVSSAAGDDLRYSNTVPTTGACTITVSYYTIES